MAKQILELWVLAGEGQAATHPLFTPHSTAEAGTRNERLSNQATMASQAGGVVLGYGGENNADGGQGNRGGEPIMVI
jgi:hypothetical protein